MYNKPEFTVDVPTAHALIHTNMFGTLISGGSGGLQATHLPILLDTERGEYGTLLAHLARANPQSAAIEAGEELLLIFTGTHGYVSSAWYADHDIAPTWAYTAVHCYGRPIIQDAREAYRAIGRLVKQMEHHREAPWRLAELGPGGMERRMPNIVCFEVSISRIEAKFKLNQDKREANVRGAIDGLHGDGQDALADLMLEYNRERLSPSHIEVKRLGDI